MSINPKIGRGIVPKIALIIVGIISISCTMRPVLREVDTESRISEEAAEIYEEMVEIRRDLHRYPELSGEEMRTAGIVAAALESYGLTVRTDVGGHGVVGVLRGRHEELVVVYRADMDALPQEIDEQEAYRSENPGIGHACGHDIHTTVGLGVARVLSSMRQELPGTVVFIFQPAEEAVEGARKMIAEGVLTDPVPQAIFALHVTPLAAGTIATTPGVGLPGIDNFVITLEGEENLDAIAATLIDSIRSIGTVHYPSSGEEWGSAFDPMFAENSDFSRFILSMAWAEKDIVPSTRIVKGFFKASGEDEYQRGRNQVESWLAAIEDKDLTAGVSWEKVLPDMFSDREIGKWAIGPLKGILGEEAVLITYQSLPFFGEDFAFYLQQIPGVMFWLGGSNTEEGIIALPHSPKFSVDEKAILAGIKGMSAVVISYLEQH